MTSAPPIDLAEKTVPRFGRIIGQSPPLQRATKLLEKAAKVDLPVLLVGETGAGKDLFALEIHDRSQRRRQPYVPVNVGALAKDLVATELFGHVKGAFTGATTDKDGRFAEADSGALFLDEIATVDERTQVALLRVLERGAYRPVGAQQDRQTNARLIAATNEDLNRAADERRFRTDLLHRLQVLQIYVPALREIPGDIPHLVRHFTSRLARKLEYDIQGVSREAMECLLRYPWPGNVRELRNVLAQAEVFAEQGYIQPEHLPARILDPEAAKNLINDVGETHQPPRPEPANTPATAEETAGESLQIPLGESLENVEKAYVQKTLRYCGNNKTRAAKLLGISRKTLYDRLERWDMKLS